MLRPSTLHFFFLAGYKLHDRDLIASKGRGSFHQQVQTGSGAHPVSYPMNSEDCFTESKAAKRPMLRICDAVSLSSTFSWRGASIKDNFSLLS
jgi:hypothetical protein